jgi:hypothetical protein
MSERYKVKSSVGSESGPAGLVRAVIATLGVKDLDGDVATAETFTDGEEVVISAWNHAAMIGGTLPVGKGIIRVTPAEAILEGQFFLQNRSAREAFTVVQEMGAAQQWSYGYKIQDAEPGMLNGEPVQFLRKVRVFEASPVVKGAGIATRTLEAKEREAIEQAREIRRRFLGGPQGDEAAALAMREFLRFQRHQFTT